MRSGAVVRTIKQLIHAGLFSPCLPGFSITAPWAFNWFLYGNENKVDISIVGTNGKFVLINAHGVLRRMGAGNSR